MPENGFFELCTTKDTLATLSSFTSNVLLGKSPINQKEENQKSSELADGIGPEIRWKDDGRHRKGIKIKNIRVDVGTSQSSWGSRRRGEWEEEARTGGRPIELAVAGRGASCLFLCHFFVSFRFAPFSVTVIIIFATNYSYLCVMIGRQKKKRKGEAEGAEGRGEWRKRVY